MFKPLFLILILFSVTGYALAQNDAEIIRHGFDAKWQTADSLLDARIKANPQDPKNYVLKQQLYYYTRYYSAGIVNNDSLMSWMVQNALKAIEIVDNSELTTENKFYAGRSYDFLSRYQIRQSIWDAYWSGRTARNYMEEVLEEDPEYYDAYMSLGVQEYFTSRLGGWTSTLAWFLGMMGERDRALEYFHIVAEKGNLCKTEAQFALAGIYRFIENDYGQSFTLTDQLLVHHPDNPFLQTQMVQTKFMGIIEKEGVEILTQEFDSLQTKYGVTDAAILNNLGYQFINLGQFDEALTIFETNIKLFPIVANCYDSYAEWHLLTGDTKNAIKYYKVAHEKLDSDTTITDQYREFLRDNIKTNLESIGVEENI